MKSIDNISLTSRQREALAEIKSGLLERFDVRAVMLYGSYARGQADEESDVDLLVVTAQPLTRFQRHEITDAVLEVNLRYDTNLSTLVVDMESWETGMVSVLPIHDEIVRDGVPI